MPRTRRFLVATVAALIGAPLLLAAALIGPAGAESPTRVAEEVAEDGVFVAFGRGRVDETALIAAVEDIRFDGIRVVVVLPRDPQPDAAAFARRIQEQTEADAALVFPDDGPLETYVVEDLSADRIRATELARQETEMAAAVRVFAEELLADRPVETPEIVGRVITWVVWMMVALGVAVALEQAWVRFRPRIGAS